MDWNIRPYAGLGPLELGMGVAEMRALMGEPSMESDMGGVRRWVWQVDDPIVNVKDGKAYEIEAFYDVENVRLEDLYLFRSDGREVLRELERRNGGALHKSGSVLFLDLGLISGRLDDPDRGEHSVALFERGAWDDALSRFEPISFDREG